MDELLLGFQLRIAPEKLEQWDAARRKTYLLREDIGAPLSVDTAVWPLSDAQRAQSALFIDYSTRAHVAPNGLGVYAVAPSLISKSASRHDDVFLIGITALDKAARSLKSKHNIQNLQSITLLRDGGWDRIGYDVADSWLCSGLMNCGYDAADKPTLSSRFGSDLDKSGLFQSVDVATSFCIECNKRISEHAPFFVYGVWTKGP